MTFKIEISNHRKEWAKMLVIESESNNEADQLKRLKSFLNAIAATVYGEGTSTGQFILRLVLRP